MDHRFFYSFLCNGPAHVHAHLLANGNDLQELLQKLFARVYIVSMQLFNRVYANQYATMLVRRLVAHYLFRRGVFGRVLYAQHHATKCHISGLVPFYSESFSPFFYSFTKS